MDWKRFQYYSVQASRVGIALMGAATYYRGFINESFRVYGHVLLNSENVMAVGVMAVVCSAIVVTTDDLRKECRMPVKNLEDSLF